MESTTWPTADFQVTLNKQVLISRDLMGRSLKFAFFCPIVTGSTYVEQIFSAVPSLDLVYQALQPEDLFKQPVPLIYPNP